MVTAQNIRDVRFTKTMGGYKAAEVDAFLDQCAETVEILNQDIEENTRKMQVLAETIVDYRNQEDSIRTALMSAQRMSETVVNEANQKATEIVAAAEEKAKEVEDEAKAQIQAELDELARIQKEVMAFRSRLLSTYREHLTLIGVLSEEVDGEEKAEERAEEQATPDAEQPEADAQADTEENVKIDISAFELKEEE